MMMMMILGTTIMIMTTIICNIFTTVSNENDMI
jgi:hypothetical protein